MIVADTSALITLTSTDVLKLVLEEFDVQTSKLVIEELEDTSEYNDSHGDAAQTILDRLDEIETHPIDGELTSSRVDPGEGSCTLLTKEIDADFLITDDLRALSELQTVSDAKVAISPIVLKALVQRDVITQEEALETLEELAEQRNWLGAPIYRRARKLF